MPGRNSELKQSGQPLWVLVVQAVAVAFGVLLITFLLIHLVPGDPARQLLGPQATESQVAELHQRMHLDDPLVSQLGKYLSGVAHGDLGQSLAYPGVSVVSLVGSSLLVTLTLVAATIVFSLISGAAIGLLAAMSRGRWLDYGIRVSAVVLLATPAFFVGLVGILVLAVQAQIAPAGGWAGHYPENFSYLWLPVLVLSAYLAPLIARAVRQKARDTLREQFIEAAMTRGLSRSRLVLRHVLPNSALPTITLVGLNIGGLIGGAVVVEAVFGLPGVGTTLVNATNSRDYPVVQAVAIITGMFVVFGNLLADIAYRLIDPRLR
ncbi:ABC transporter permease [Amycolatopsis sp. GM8]|uniref:ABC transporter permease n=1 Tax=Amycolatopsis sp. GM8 TaxID=2896530 RepID=UPI001F463A0A|nr:ABC transporter permease [Amycolatopsis sp. GM8]